MPSSATITSYFTFAGGTKARATEVNSNFENHRGHILPINVNTATASDDTHDLGADDHNFRKAYIASGFFTLGNIQLHHSYNGVAPIGEGWMLCDGSTICADNYNTFHGGTTTATNWATYIVSSPLDGLVTPNLIGRYAVGVSLTTQGGTATMSTVGNTNSTLNLAHVHSITGHSHSIAAHTHNWYVAGGTAQSYDGSGAPVNIANTSGATIGIATGSTVLNRDYYGNSEVTNATLTALTTESNLSAAQDIRPDSVEVEYYIRII